MNYKYGYEDLIDLLGAYRRQIIRSGKAYPTVVLNDIFDSINYVLDKNEYNGRYASDNGKSYK